MNRLPQLILLFFLVLLALSLAGAVTAQEPVTDDEVNDIAKDLYCPVCENTPLDVCGTQACADWREEIRMQLAQGKTQDDIEQYFVERYGPRVLAAPPQEGFNLLVWLLPVAAVLVGAFVFGRYLSSLRREPTAREDAIEVPPTPAPAPPSAADDDYISRIEKEVGQ